MADIARFLPLLVISIVLLFFSVDALTDPDKQWELQKKRLQRRGIRGEIERTPEWEQKNRRRAIFFIVFSLVIFAFSMWPMLDNLSQ